MNGCFKNVFPDPAHRDKIGRTTRGGNIKRWGRKGMPKCKWPLVVLTVRNIKARKVHFKALFEAEKWTFGKD